MSFQVCFKKFLSLENMENGKKIKKFHKFSLVTIYNAPVRTNEHFGINVSRQKEHHKKLSFVPKKLCMDKMPLQTTMPLTLVPYWAIYYKQ